MSSLEILGSVNKNKSRDLVICYLLFQLAVILPRIMIVLHKQKTSTLVLIVCKMWILLKNMDIYFSHFTQGVYKMCTPLV